MDIRRGSRLEAITQGQCWAGDNAINKSALIDTDEKWPCKVKNKVHIHMHEDRGRIWVKLIYAASGCRYAGYLKRPHRCLAALSPQCTKDFNAR